MMSRQHSYLTAGATLLFAFLLPVTRTACAQTPTALPKLDLTQYMGTWYEIASYPATPQKHCLSDAVVLYALGDKRNTFQLVISCRVKDGNSDSWNAKGKMDKVGDGKLKLSYIFPFSVKYWVLATGPAFEWTLIGSPNHKTLYVLSKSSTLMPEVLAEIESKAAAEGFDTSKLVKVIQHD